MAWYGTSFQVLINVLHKADILILMKFDLSALSCLQCSMFEVYSAVSKKLSPNLRSPRFSSVIFLEFNSLLPLYLCQRSAGYIFEHLFLDCLLCSTDPSVHSLMLSYLNYCSFRVNLKSQSSMFPLLTYCVAFTYKFIVSLSVSTK